MMFKVFKTGSSGELLHAIWERRMLRVTVVLKHELVWDEVSSKGMPTENSKQDFEIWDLSKLHKYQMIFTKNLENILWNRSFLSPAHDTNRFFTNKKVNRHYYPLL